MDNHRNDLESLEDLLKGSDIPSCVDRDRSKLLATRAWSIHRARSVRMSRMKATVALAGCYMAGLLTMGLIHSETHDVVGTGRAASVNVSTGVASEASTRDELNQSAETAKGVRQERFSRLPDEATSPLAVPAETAYSRYRALGDTYLEQRNGIETAAECYAAALDQATDDELESLAEQDSWLLIALKKERREDI